MLVLVVDLVEALFHYPLFQFGLNFGCQPLRYHAANRPIFLIDEPALFVLEGEQGPEPYNHLDVGLRHLNTSNIKYASKD